jgi:hypothetical protein
MKTNERCCKPVGTLFGAGQIHFNIAAKGSDGIFRGGARAGLSRSWGKSMGHSMEHIVHKMWTQHVAVAQAMPQENSSAGLVENVSKEFSNLLI